MDTFLEILAKAKGIFTFRQVGFSVLILAALLLARCSFKRVTVDAGTEGVIVAKPYFIGNGGVTGDKQTSGAFWTWKSNEVWAINTRPQQVSETFNDMITADSIPVHFDAHLNYMIDDTVTFVRAWGMKWYEANVQQMFRTAARDECKRYKMTELISNPAIARQIEATTLAEIRAFAKEKKLPIIFSALNIGNISPKEDVMKEIAQTAVQQQRQRTENERKKAEDQRRATETSRAAADNAYREAMNLQPEQYIRLEAVKAYSHAAEECAKNDKCTMILTQPGGDIKGTVPLR